MPAEIKILEIRDVATCIPILAIRFEATESANLLKENQLIRYAGWSFDTPVVEIRRLIETEQPKWLSSNSLYIFDDPLSTFSIALKELRINWENYSSGDVIECGFLSGRAEHKQGSDL
jgi:hypothetical protein